MLGRLSVLKVVRLKLSKFFRSFILSLKRIPHLHNKSEYKKLLRLRTALIGILGLIIGISLVSVFLLKGRGASANWYNDNWKYRKSVALPNHTAEESNVFITIPIDTATLISAGKLQSDCGDFRFTDNTGKLLEYYISSGCNTSDTKIDVNMTTYGAGSLVLHAYYGNPLVENGFSLTGFSTSASNNAATINLQVNASGNDGDTQIAGDLDNSLTRAFIPMGVYNGNTHMAVVRFLGASIPQGTTITSATFTLTGLNTWDCGGCSMDYILFGEDADTATALTLDNMNNLTPTTANATWSLPSVVAESEYSKDVTSIIQEIVSRGGWSTGNAISIILADNGSDYGEWQEFYSYDGSTSKAAKLSITYSSGGTPAFGSEEIAPGPAAYWRFDEGYGTGVNDTSGNSQTGTLGTGSSAPTWRSEEYCQNGSCLQFDGTDDYIQWADSSTLDIENELTISLWVKPISLQSSTYYTLVYKGNSTNEVNYYFQLYGDELNFGTYQSGWRGTNTTNADIQTNQWSHVVVTYSDASDDIDFYVNGILKSDDGFSHNLVLSADNQPFYLGSSAADLEFYDGFMDEVKIYPYVRSADEIKQDYLFSGAKGAAAVLGTQDRSFLSEGLVGYWKMDETTGTTGPSWTAVDSSGNGNNGTGVGDAGPGVGKYGNGGNFDGTGDEIAIGDNTSLRPNRLTISFWANTSSLASNDQKTITKGATSSQETYIVGPYFGTWRFVLRDTSYSIYALSAGSGITTSTWEHVTATYDGDYMRIYLNGELSNSVQIGDKDLSQSTTNLGIGGPVDTTSYNYSGEVDEVRIYNRALSSSEIKTLYQWAPGPVIYYDFDQGTGTTAVNDRSGNGRSGTMQNFSNSAWKDGKYGKGLLFDGSSTYVGVTSPSLPTADFTYSFWANFKDIAVGGNEAVLDTGGNEFTIIITDGSFNIHTNGSWRTYTPTNVTTNTWNYVTVSRSGSTISVYLNGELENTATDGTAFDFSTCELLIGVDANSGCNASLADYSNLVMDELKIYNYARTRDQILQDMNAGHPLIGTPVGSSSLHLKFDEGYGTTANDSSTQGNDGSISSATWTNDGKYGKALSFNGTSGYVNAGSDSSLDDLTTMSVSAWIYPTGYGEGSYGRIVNKSDTSGTNWGLTLVNNTSQQSIRFFKERNSGANATQVTASDGSIQLNQWYHVVGTYDENATPRMRIFINGHEASYSEQIEGTGSPDSDSTYNLTIGNRLNEDRTFQGTIDEVLLYPFALTADQVKVLNNGGKTLVLGAKSTGVGGSAPSNSAGREYCIPGDASTCNAPIAEWSMDDGVVGASQTIADTSGNGNSGTTQSSNGTGMNCTTPGKIGKGCTLDGTDDYIQVTDPGTGSILDFSNGDPITLEAWIKPTALPSLGTYRTFLTKGGISDGQLNYLLEIGNVGGSGIFDFCYSTSGFAYHCYEPSGTVLDVGKWQHIAMTFTFGTGSSIKLYKNGQLLIGSWSSGDGSGTPAETNQDLWIGADGTPSYFNGVIDQVKIYDYTRTQAQIAWDYNRGAPIAWYKMDECQGTTVYNSALNADGKAAGNNGTLSIGGSGEDTVGNCSTSSTAWGSGATGKINSAVDFDGTDDYVEVADNDALDFVDGRNLSISLWVKLDAVANDYTMLSKKTSQAASDAGYMIFFNDPSDIIDFRVADGTDQFIVSSKANLISTGTWVHITAVYVDGDASASTIYINGKAQKDSTTGNIASVDSLANSVGLRFGTQGNGSSDFDGQIDDVRIFNYALTAEQAKQIYNNGAVSFE
ncbi:hypothetical protein IPM65_03440 [Candidatus Roizmanbacteria bacterium]|nr:MAG: hypothetical protein IPM65_03440 [Candidatus Roizmanbacteria bacterium]